MNQGSCNYRVLQLRGLAVRTAAPEDDLCLIDVEAGSFGHRQRRRVVAHTFHIDRVTARPTNQMVMVIDVRVEADGPGAEINQLDLAQVS
jgi:tRNA U38,U39,U40 pseudouridine synthase TruA